MRETDKVRRRERELCRLFVLAFITGNSSLQPLLEGLFAQIHIHSHDPTLLNPALFSLSYGDGCITEDPPGSSKKSERREEKSAREID